MLKDTLQPKNNNDHTFVICAYKESEYLEECVLSLKNQTISSGIIMVTSTPNPKIKETADRYQIPLFVNEGEGGIAQDWNFGMQQCTTRYITIAHQDDTYEKNYLECILKYLQKSSRPMIAFTDYGEIRNGQICDDSGIVRIKRKMLIPLRARIFWKSRFVRRRILGMGNAICCPAVTYVMDQLEKPVFEVGLGSNLDWQTWERLSRQKGAFVYVPQILMHHRIHNESTTSELINNHQRSGEDYEMFSRFWPSWIAGILTKIYSKSEQYNNTDN